MAFDSSSPAQILPLAFVVGHGLACWIVRLVVAIDKRTPVVISPRRPTNRCHAQRPTRFAQVIEEAHDHGRLNYKSDRLPGPRHYPRPQRVVRGKSAVIAMQMAARCRDETDQASRTGASLGLTV